MDLTAKFNTGVVVGSNLAMVRWEVKWTAKLICIQLRTKSNIRLLCIGQKSSQKRLLLLDKNSPGKVIIVMVNIASSRLDIQ